MHSLTSDEVNLLVYRYFVESGFKHSSFTFGYECDIQKNNLKNGADVPIGALVSLIQKGIQYTEIEAKLFHKEQTDEDVEAFDIEYDNVFHLLNPEFKDKLKIKSKNIEKPMKDKDDQNGSNGTITRGRLKKDETDEVSDSMSLKKKKTRRDQRNARKKKKISQISTTGSKDFDSKKSTPDPDDMEIIEESSSKASEKTIEIPDSQVTTLKGHLHEVFICAWNPKDPLKLASGSGDSTARIWTVPQGSMGDTASNVANNSPLVLHHSTGKGKPNQNKDVTTLDWSHDGTMLATGSYDGKARIWQNDGKLAMTLDQHQGPIFSLKWNKSGNFLLSGSVDNSAIIWDVKTGEAKQQFKNHKAPTLDVDWRTDTSFATCSTDKMIYVCKLGETEPLRVFQGHTDEVNAIRWDPSSSLLASCSDDFTAKIWNMKSEKPLHDFTEHTKEIYTLKWSPTGPKSANPNMKLLLATASFDSTVKLWDVETGKSLYNLTKHKDPVYSVSFSPNGEYLASGSFDTKLNIWSVKDGKLIRTFKGHGSIFEVCWNCRGDKVAACFSDSIKEDFTVNVIDFRM